jgi:prepilin-type N-terminal cleavage/methylation domain-containing protein/prepilin-type processing-associated H-X9-DG protein
MFLQTNRQVCRNSHGFTLLELLVVMAIVVVLVGMLLAVIGRARQSAKSVSCMSNLRQMAIAARAYADANNDDYPIAYYFGGDGTKSITYCWDLTTVGGTGLPTIVTPGLLWEGLAAEQIQQCPSFEGAANWLVDPYTGYNYNTSYIGHGQYESIPAPAKTTSIRRPTMTALFGDGQWVGGANKFMRAPFPNPGDNSFSGRWAGTQGFRHLGRTNVAFCDGHAESLSTRFSDNADGAEYVAPGTGFLSKDNSMYNSR